MKRLLILIAAALLLPILPTLADGPDALFPAMGENGLWGYIDRTGAFVIAPQYAAVSPARGYADKAGLFMAVSAQGGADWGLIDWQGRAVLPPEYLITWSETDFAVYAAPEGTDLAEAFKQETQQAGFFDTASGTFSGFQWQDVALSQKGMGLVPVQRSNDLWGYANADAGRGALETVILCQYTAAYGFHANPGAEGKNGWAFAEFPPDHEGRRESVLLCEDGHFVSAPEGYELANPYAFSQVTEGKAAIVSASGENADDESDRMAGYMDTKGNILFLIEDKWYDLYPYENDWAVCYSYDDGTGRYIDGEGRFLEGVTARPEGRGGYGFSSQGYTSVFADEKPAIMDDNGRVCLVLTGEDQCWIWNVMDNGLAWYEEWHPEDSEDEEEQFRYGLLSVETGILTPAVYSFYEDEGSPFAEGLAAVSSIADDSLYGYLNEQGEWVIEPRFVYADTFRNGFACVRTAENRIAWIDRTGQEIYGWVTDIEPYREPLAGMPQEENLLENRSLSDRMSKTFF